MPHVSGQVELNAGGHLKVRLWPLGVTVGGQVGVAVCSNDCLFRARGVLGYVYRYFCGLGGGVVIPPVGCVWLRR